MVNTISPPTPVENKHQYKYKKDIIMICFVAILSLVTMKMEIDTLGGLVLKLILVQVLINMF